MRRQVLAAVAALFLSAGSIRAEVVIETVPVGNPRNADDTEGAGRGRVEYVYNIGKFEVTAGQYKEFLNAVAATDTHGLYNPSMDTSDYGCQITQNGASGSFTYDFTGRPSGTEADWANRPVNYVSWGDAARFANWLHNGQPGLDTPVPQDEYSTEDGSYHMNGAIPDAELMVAVRTADATWVIPSEDEWYKAAYHYNDGPTGNYYDYPTASDTAPTSAAPPGTDMTNGSANFYAEGWAIGSPYLRTEVGAYSAKPSESPYGTFDQAGNVWEWDETAYGQSRGLLGGSFYNLYRSLHAAYRLNLYPTVEYFYIGFRVAEVRLDCATLATDCSVFAKCIAGPDVVASPWVCSCPDLDGDNDVDMIDFARFQVAFVGS